MPHVKCRRCKRIRRDLFLILLQSISLGYGFFSYQHYGKTSLGIGITLLILVISELCKRVDKQTQTLYLLYGNRAEDKPNQRP